ncbi:MAG: hypothetical protein MJZ37_09970 [Bacilli bacterium]|nr:hypothetical protein [Bacilli bacterium]
MQKGRSKLIMIGAIFDTIKSAITSFTSALGDVFSGLESMFFTTTSGATVPTMLGTLLLIAAGVGIVYWAFRLIKSLVARA